MGKKYSLEGKTIFITGASSGIGAQAAISTGEAGARLIITGRDEKRLNDTLHGIKGKDHKSYTSDLTDESHINDLVDKLPELDGIVHCAGITSHLPVQFVNSKSLTEVFGINFVAPVLLTSRSLKKKKIRDNSSIVFLSSISTEHPYFGGSLYVSTKSALEGYSKVLAMELSSRRIRSNCLSPGIVRTPMVDKTEETISKETLKKYEDMSLLGTGKPADVADVILFFLSDASRWITGTNLELGGV